MIPTIETLQTEITKTSYPTRTYKVIIDKDRISGYTDEVDAVNQAVYLILSTERYKHLIYSWDYGVELLDLIGKPMPYVRAELPRRIKDALVTDNRIKDVVDFVFKPHGKILGVQFTVVTDAGKIYVALEVEV